MKKVISRLTILTFISALAFTSLNLFRINTVSATELIKPLSKQDWRACPDPWHPGLYVVCIEGTGGCLPSDCDD